MVTRFARGSAPCRQAASAGRRCAGIWRWMIYSSCSHLGLGESLVNHARHPGDRPGGVVRKVRGTMTYWCGQCKKRRPIAAWGQQDGSDRQVIVRGPCAVCGAPIGAIGVPQTAQQADRAQQATARVLVRDVLAVVLGSAGYAVRPPGHPEAAGPVLDTAGCLDDEPSGERAGDRESWQPHLLRVRCQSRAARGARFEATAVAPAASPWQVGGRI
jgi:hypothetical protein